MKDFSRRNMLKGTLVAATTVAVGGGLALNRQAEAGQDTTAAETYEYKGRRIILHPVANRSAGAESLMSAVFIDGRPLHVSK